MTTTRPIAPALTREPIATSAREMLAANDYDVVLAADWSLAELGALVPDRPVVLNALDAAHVNFRARSELFRGFRRLLHAHEARRVERFERRFYPRCAAVVVVSAEDGAALQRLDDGIRIEVVPNGVDADHFSPRAEIPPEPGLIVFTGAMDWPPNVQAADYAAREVLPRLRRRRPDARLAIVGRNPGEEVLALGREDGVEVTGEVPDIRDWLWRGEAFICPMVSGTGIKNKLLEALACGVPSVATPLACQGMAVRDGTEVMIAGDPSGLVERLESVLSDRPLAERLASAGRAYAVSEHSWRTVGQRYERLLGQAVSDADPGSTLRRAE